MQNVKWNAYTQLFDAVAIPPPCSNCFLKDKPVPLPSPSRLSTILHSGLKNSFQASPLGLATGNP